MIISDFQGERAMAYDNVTGRLNLITKHWSSWQVDRQ